MNAVAMRNILFMMSQKTRPRRHEDHEGLFDWLTSCPSCLRGYELVTRRRPTKYTIAPIPSTAADKPTIFTTANSLFGSSADGTHASTIATAVVRNPMAPKSVAPGLPP